MADETVVVATFLYRHEGEFALETLREAGINAALLADDAGGAYAALSFSRGVRILVDSSDAERAKELLAGPGNPDDSEAV
jgi:hypothetical protein